jgi:predicted alpha/beta hydrolase family esterase
MVRMRTWLYIHGADSFKSKGDFLEYLRTVPLREPGGVGERPKRWPDTLAADLGPGVTVIAPSMPNKQNADYDEWKVWFERHLPLVTKPYGLLGWSQGGYFLAKYLAENEFEVPPAALVLVAAPAGLIEDPGGDNPAWTFDLPSLQHALARYGTKTFVFHSEDDPIVPFSHALQYQEGLPGATLVPLVDKGHCVVERFPELLDCLRGL